MKGGHEANGTGLGSPSHSAEQLGASDGRSAAAVQQQQQHAVPMWKQRLQWLRPSQKPSVSVSAEMLILSAAVYGVLVFSIGKVFLPGGGAFEALLIWICSLVGAHIAHFLRVPRVVGMLGTGLLLANVPGGVVAAFPRKWGVQMRAAALATIFLRCGLELEFKTISLYKWPAARLALLPGLAEALFDAGVAVAVFHMPFTLALSLGFILKAVGPGLVVPAMFQLQKWGLGADKGIPSTVVIAASFDDIIAITGFSIFINIAIATGSSAAWQIASGPLQVVFGMVGGILAGIAMGCTRLFDNRYKRFIGIYASALLVMFFLEYFDMLSGGALGSLTVGLVTCYMWEHGKPARASLGPNNGYSADVERVAAMVWNWVMEPMLFATIGTSIVFAKLPDGTIPKSLLVVCTGLVLRTLCTGVVMGGRRYNWKERLFFAVAWTPKATVQASLSAVPLLLIDTYMAGQPDYAQWQQWGSDILATGIFAIIVCASVGTLLVYWTAPVLLERGAVEPSIARDSRTALTRPGSRQLPKQGSLDSGTTVAHRPSGAQLPADSASLVKDLVEGKDHTLINAYFDSIEQLVALVRDGRGQQARDEGLCDRVSRLQETIERDVGPRELTVRQMLHSTALRCRQPTLAASAADTLVALTMSERGAGPCAPFADGRASHGDALRLLPPVGGDSSGRGARDEEQGLPLESVGSCSGGRAGVGSGAIKPVVQ